MLFVDEKCNHNHRLPELPEEARGYFKPLNGKMVAISMPDYISEWPVSTIYTVYCKNSQTVNFNVRCQSDGGNPGDWVADGQCPKANVSTVTPTTTTQNYVMSTSRKDKTSGTTKQVVITEQQGTGSSQPKTTAIPTQRSFSNNETASVTSPYGQVWKYSYGKLTTKG